MYRVAVLDDEPLCCDQLAEEAAERLAARGIACEIERFTAADELMDAVRPGRFDLYLMDVLLDEPDRTGVDVARFVRDADGEAGIVFATVSLDHAPDGYEVDAAGYVLKPLDADRFDRALDRALSRRPSREAVVMRTPQRTVRFFIDELAYLEIRSHTLDLHFLDGHVEQVNVSIASALERLPAQAFVSCHRSFAVNVGAVRSVRRYCVTLTNGEEVPVSRARYADVQRALMQRMKSR